MNMRNLSNKRAVYLFVSSSIYETKYINSIIYLSYLFQNGKPIHLLFDREEKKRWGKEEVELDSIHKVIMFGLGVVVDYRNDHRFFPFL